MSPELAHGVGHETILAIAALVLCGGGAIVLVLAGRTRYRGVPVSAGTPAATAGEAEGASVARSLTLMLVGLSIGAAVIHLAAAPGHYVELGDLGAGFVVAAGLQAAWAWAAFRGPSRRTVWLGAAINATIVLAWAWTRAVGLPVGPAAGSPEPIGLPDVASTVFEVLLLVGLAVQLVVADRSIARRAPVARTLASVVVVPVLGLVLVTTSLATVAIASGLDHGSVAGGISSLHAAGH
jgi:hypothetical protein